MILSIVDSVGLGHLKATCILQQHGIVPPGVIPLLMNLAIILDAITIVEPRMSVVPVTVITIMDGAIQLVILELYLPTIARQINVITMVHHTVHEFQDSLILQEHTTALPLVQRLTIMLER